jgi:hypothetical protein
MHRLIVVAVAFVLFGNIARADILNRDALAQQYFPTNTAWFKTNVPFMETSDANIQQIYYYRWDLVNKHLNWLPDKQHWVFTEFTYPVWWESPDRTISAPAAHHINEARWLRDHTYVDSYVDYWMKGYGNPYQYTFWAADAVYQNYLASGNAQMAAPYLMALKQNYDVWAINRFDPSRQMFWQVPLQDATEWSVSSSMVNDGQGGDAYRPTMNSYMYASALAISRIAQLAGDSATAQDYAARAASLKSKVQTELWNPAMQAFMDRFTARYPNLDYQFIDSRELGGIVPWNFNLPDDSSTYSAAWNRVLASDGFLGPHGLRTVEPSSPHYFSPAPSGPGSDFNTWNGPSWPYYTSMILGGLANVLDHYSNHNLTRADYMTLLRGYTLQQYKDGHPYIAEEYQPDDGYWLVDVPNRSEHYFHSTYDDLIITGLAGLRPRADDIVEINPLLDPSISYLALEKIPYHQHEITIVWDQVDRYGLGNGLHLLVNGHEMAFSPTIARLTATLPYLGDANFDGEVDVADLGLLASNWQSSADWSGGDFNHDGLVDVVDLGILSSNWQVGASGSAKPTARPWAFAEALDAFGLSSVEVPEPAFLYAAVIGMLILRRR